MHIYKTTFSSLRFTNFRLYFYGQVISLSGNWMQQIAMSWLVYRLTGSVALLGTIYFISQIPMFFMTPLSSAIIDKVNKKIVLILTQILFILHALTLTILYFTNLIEVWHLISLSFLLGIINAFDNPTRQAFYTSLVPKEFIINAVALNSTVLNATRLIGPAIAGFLIIIVGEGGCFLINSITYIFSIIFLLMIRLHKDSIKHKPISIINDIKEGFNYMHKNIPIKVLMAITLLFCFFIFPLITFIPAYVKDILNMGSETLGLIMSFIGVGSLLASLYIASRKEILSLGKIQFIGILVCGLIVMPFFFVGSLIITILLSIILGFTMVCAIASTNTILQALTHNEMKGRIMGYYLMFFTLGASFGNLFFGYLADILSLPYSMLISGALTIIGLLFYIPYYTRVNQLTKDKYIEIGILPNIPL